jgi:hypothetical protein
MRTFSDTEIHIATNAIAWELNKDKSKDGVVDVSKEEAEGYRRAAHRALLQIEEYRDR